MSLKSNQHRYLGTYDNTGVNILWEARKNKPVFPVTGEGSNKPGDRSEEVNVVRGSESPSLTPTEVDPVCHLSWKSKNSTVVNGHPKRLDGKHWGTGNTEVWKFIEKEPSFVLSCLSFGWVTRGSQKFGSFCLFAYLKNLTHAYSISGSYPFQPPPSNSLNPKSHLSPKLIASFL